MTSGNVMKYTSILLTYPVLLGVVGLLMLSIVLLKKYGKYDKTLRRVVIFLLVITPLVSLYLLYLAFAFGNPHPPFLPIPLQ